MKVNLFVFMAVRLFSIFVLAFVVGFLTVVYAQATSGVGNIEVPGLGKVADWFASTAALSVVVGALVALIRKVWKSLDGLAVVGVAVAVGVGLSIAGKLLGLLNLDWLPVVIFGAQAALQMSGGLQLVKDLGKSIVGGGNGNAPAGDTATDYSRTRDRLIDQ